MVAILCRHFGLQRLDRIQDIVNDAFVEALTKWRFSGIPDNPSGWLMTVARNKAINAFKRDGRTVLPGEEALRGMYSAPAQELDIQTDGKDEQLRLLLLCCHQEFSIKNQVMLTLHILSGFGVREIARALLMETEAVKRALTRSKTRLKAQAEYFHADRKVEVQTEQREAIHTALYLMFNEGYKTTRAKEVIDHDLCYEAIRLSKLVASQFAAHDAETQALLALMFFNLARFPARISQENELVTLANQDRSKWNKAFIEEGYYYLNRATQSDQLTRYHLEAIIASVHCTTPSFEQTDWKTLVYLYRQLEDIYPSPMARLNRIVAESYYLGPVKSMAELEELKQSKSLQHHYLLHAAEGDLWKRQHKWPEAEAAFHQALAYASSPAEQQFLASKIKECKYLN